MASEIAGQSSGKPEAEATNNVTNIIRSGHIEDIDKIGMYAATSLLQQKASSVRVQRPNWQSYLQGQVIDKYDYDLLVKLEACSSSSSSSSSSGQQQQQQQQRNAIIADKESQFPRTFLNLLSQISKEETLQYLLTLLDDLLLEDKLRVELFKDYTAKRKISVWEPLFALMHGSNGFIVNQAARIVAKFACWSTQLMDHSELVHYLNWLKDQLRLPTNEYLQTVARCLQMMLRVSHYRQVFCDIDGIATLADVLSTKLSYQIQYQLVFCLWCLSFDADIVMRMKKYHLIPICADILCESEKEKVNRIVCALFRHLLEKVQDDQQQMQENALAMVQCRVLKQVALLVEKKYDDIEYEDDLAFLHDKLSNSLHDLTSFDEYCSELRAGRLDWSSPVHKSERFWRENVTRLNENNYELLRILVTLLDTSNDAIVLSVAAHDIGEYVRHYPRGKSVIEQLGAKQMVMKMLTSSHPSVKYNALVAVQKIMVHNWEYLGKQIEEKVNSPVTTPAAASSAAAANGGGAAAASEQQQQQQQQTVS